MKWLESIVCGGMCVMAFTSTARSEAELSADKTSKSPPPEMVAYRINPHPPTIDGRLDDKIWDPHKVDIQRVFTQQEPDEGALPSESTLVAVAYDDDAMYVAFWCYDSEPELIARQLVRRDRYAESDKVSIAIDAFHDHQSASRFEVSAAGVQLDTRYFDDGNSDRSWDAVWESAVMEHPWGWAAELRIPYHCVRFSQGEDQTWGVNFTRNINRNGEYLKWAYSPSSEGGFVSNFGHLRGMKNIRPARQLEVLPYVVSKAEIEPGSPGNPNGRSTGGNSGFDLKYAVSPSLILDASINPDFGQVELDQPVLNLSTYESFFPERRPFFLEGSDLFDTDFNLFYSRRIGRSPRANVDDPDLLYYTNYPDNTTILGAGKVTGKLFSRTSIAVLTAVTQEEQASYAAQSNVVLDSTFNGTDWDTFVASADTVSRKGRVNRQANYSVIRVKQEVLDQSSLGGMLTVASPQGDRAAVAGGVDWRLTTSNSGWITSGQVVFSRVDNSNTGFGLDVSIEKAAGKHVRGAIGGQIKDPYLNINDLGFNSRSNSKNSWVWLQYRTTDDWWIVRNSYNNINWWGTWNYQDVNIEHGGNFNIEFKNYWSLGGGTGLQFEPHNDRETRGNGIWEWPVYPTQSWWLSLNTDNRKKLSFNLNPGGGADRGGSWWSNYVGVDYRPRSNMEFSTGINYTENRGNLRWVDQVGDSSLFADLDRNQVFLHASASMSFNPNLSLQLSAEGLISGLDYSGHRYYQGGKNYSGQVAGFDNYDYNFSALNSTLLLRWEYRPGSTIYAVWTRSRPEFDPSVNDLQLSRDIGRLFSGDAQNLFLIKASYWLHM